MLTEKLKALCVPTGISGNEKAATEVFRSLVMPYCDSFEYDKSGNFYAYRYCGRENAPLIMLEAHADKIGLMVRHITKEGFVLFSEIGGFDAKVLPTSNVLIHGSEKVFGTIAVLPVHVKKGDDEKVTPSSDLFIDTGFSYEEITGRIKVGDFIEILTEFTPLSGNFVAASALDDRAGLLTIAECARLLKGADTEFDVLFCATSQEEVGCRGAAAAAKKANPYISISVDVCHGKTPDASENVFECGCGPVITVGPNVQRPISNALIKCAKVFDIPYEIDVDSGNTGTNAWVIQVAGMGVFTGLISLPLRYMHTPYEVIDLRDIEHSAHLLAEFIKGLKGGSICY